jgi:hypothetical protein
MTRLAWETHLTLADVERARGSAIVFSSRARMSGVAAVVDPAAGPLWMVARAGEWQVLRSRGAAHDQLAVSPGNVNANVKMKSTNP